MYSQLIVLVRNRHECKATGTGKAGRADPGIGIPVPDGRRDGRRAVYLLELPVHPGRIDPPGGEQGVEYPSGRRLLPGIDEPGMHEIRWTKAIAGYDPHLDGGDMNERQIAGTESLHEGLVDRKRLRRQDKRGCMACAGSKGEEAYSVTGVGGMQKEPGIMGQARELLERRVHRAGERASG